MGKAILINESGVVKFVKGAHINNVSEFVSGETYLLKETEELCHLVSADGKVFDFPEHGVEGIFVGTVNLTTGVRAIFWVGAIGGYAMFGTEDLSYVVE